MLGARLPGARIGRERNRVVGRMLTFAAYASSILSLACDFANPCVGVSGCLSKGVLLFVLGRRPYRPAGGFQHVTNP